MRAMPDSIRLVDARSVFKSSRLELVEESFDTPDGEMNRAIIHHPGSVAIIAEPEAGTLLLVRQYRYSIRRETLEIPAGTLDPNEDPIVCAGRELIEETGYRAGHLEELVKLYPAIGICDELQYFFRASDLSPDSMNPDEGEFIEPEILNHQQIAEAISSGLICDSKTLLVLQFIGMNSLV